MANRNPVYMPSKETLTADQFQTPPDICTYMASLIPRKARTILEPFPGQGNLTRALEDLPGSEVTAPDDYFKLDRAATFEAVATNPPFSQKTVFNMPHALKHLEGMRVGYYLLKDVMARTNNTIALMPFFTITDSDRRNRVLFEYGIRSITILPRGAFSYTRIQTIVMELENGYRGQSEIILYQNKGIPALAPIAPLIVAPDPDELKNQLKLFL